MEKLLEYCEFGLTGLGLHINQPNVSRYKSVIKFEGQSILPPVMTEGRRAEMAEYKHLALAVESRLNARARMKRLASAQAAMRLEHNQESYSSSTLSPSDETLPSSKSEYDEMRTTQSEETQILENITAENVFQEGGNIHDETSQMAGDDISDRPHSDQDGQGTMSDIPDLSSEIVVLSEKVSGYEAENECNQGLDGEYYDHSDYHEYDKSQICSEHEIDHAEDYEKEGTGDNSHDEEDNIPDNDGVKSQTFKSPPVGSKERMEILVKKLDLALKFHEKQRTSTSMGRSMTSTNSSATLRSEEMNRTVISKDEIISIDSLADENLHDDGEKTDTETTLDNQFGNDQNSTLQHESYQGDVDSDNTEDDQVVSQGLSDTRSSLLSRVVFDMSDDTTSEVFSEPEPVSAHTYSSSQGDLPESVLNMLNVVEHVELPHNMVSMDPGVAQAIQDHIADTLKNEQMIGSEGRQVIESITEDITKHDQSGNKDEDVKKPQESNEVLYCQSGNVTKTPDNNGSKGTDELCAAHAHSIYESSSLSLPTGELNTESTELAPYMKYSLATTTGSITSLPHEEISGNSSSTPINSQQSKSERLASSQEIPSGAKQSGSIRRSYTLEHPSPVLVAACCASSMSSADRNSAPINTTAKLSNLTSSMEDLKLKPVQRRLDYETVAAPIEQTVKSSPEMAAASGSSPEIQVGDSVTTLVHMDGNEGKEEHLHRYLHQLSQLPSHRAETSLEDQQGYIMAPSEPNHILPSDPHPAYGYNAHPATLPMSNMNTSNITQMSQMDIMQYQMQSFEMLRHQMMEQQQQQLMHLFAEHERQQLLLQQELLNEQKKTLTRSMKSEQHQQTTKGYPTSMSVPPFVGGKVVQPAYGVIPEEYIEPSPATDTSPSGVYCDQNFPVSQDGSFMDMNTRTHEVDYQAPWSPAVLRNGLASKSAGGMPQHVNEFQQLGYPNSSYQQPVPYTFHDNPALLIQNSDLPPDMRIKFDKISAVAKGFLVRKLMKTDKVQQLIQTIRDTAEFALKVQLESPRKKGPHSYQDLGLLQRVLAQLTAAMYEVHEIFFDTSAKERMSIIQQSRLMEKAQFFKEIDPDKTSKSRRISDATKKALERKKKTDITPREKIQHSRPMEKPQITNHSGSLSATIPRKISAATRKTLERKRKTRTPEGVVVSSGRKSCPPDIHHPKLSKNLKKK